MTDKLYGFKISYSNENKKYIAQRALELRKKYNLSLKCISHRFGFKHHNILRNILIELNLYEEFKNGQ